MGDWELTAIILKSHEGLAIVNGSILREGDVVEGARVRRILRDRVILVQEGKRIEVKISPFGED